MSMPTETIPLLAGQPYQTTLKEARAHEASQELCFACDQPRFNSSNPTYAWSPKPAMSTEPWVLSQESSEDKNKPWLKMWPLSPLNLRSQNLLGQGKSR